MHSLDMTMAGHKLLAAKTSILWDCRCFENIAIFFHIFHSYRVVAASTIRGPGYDVTSIARTMSCNFFLSRPSWKATSCAIFKASRYSFVTETNLAALFDMRRAYSQRCVHREVEKNLFTVVISGIYTCMTVCAFKWSAIWRKTLTCVDLVNYRRCEYGIGIQTTMIGNGQLIYSVEDGQHPFEDEITGTSVTTSHWDVSSTLDSVSSDQTNIAATGRWNF